MKDSVLEKYAEDPLLFFEKELKIRTKAGGRLAPFVLNKAQKYVHGVLEKQVENTGRVRVLLLKGRQQGMSTYTEARFFHKNIFGVGTNTVIIAHDANASKNLFSMAKLFYDELAPFCRPELGASNWQTLEFALAKNRYQVFTAGSRDAGRSTTVHNFHGSEVAFWDKAEHLLAGVMQAVSDTHGTEIILESTGQAGSWFHEFWISSVAGQTEFEPVFIPWTWQAEYSVDDVPFDFEPTEDEMEIVAAHGLTLGQLLWRRNKISILGVDKFRQEYPLTPDEAFSAVEGDPYIPIEVLFKSMHEGKNVDMNWRSGAGAVILGVDVARFGDDKTAFVWRQGRRVLRIRTYKRTSVTQVADLIKEAMRDPEMPVDRCFLDVGGVGGGVYDTSIDLVLSASEVEKLKPVDFASAAFNKQRFDIRRNEIWSNMRDWFMDPDIAVYLPESPALVRELSGPMKKFKDGKLCVESKDDMKKRGLRSPDVADALALTFAYPVSSSDLENYSGSGTGAIYAKERNRAYIVY